MRIAIFSECYSPIVNGVVIAVSTLCHELRDLGHEVNLFTPNFPGYHDTDSFVFRFPSISLPTNPRYPIGIPFLTRGTHLALQEFSPQIIHTHSLFGAGRLAAKVAKSFHLPLIFTYHTLIEAYSHYIPLPQGFVRAMARRVSKDFADWADYIISPGPASFEALRRYGVKTPIEIIPTGADLSLAEGPLQPGILQKWGIPEGAPVVAFAGRIAKEKNLELLLEAFAQVVHNLPSAHLMLIGGGPWQAGIAVKAASLGLSEKTHITGFLPRPEVVQTLRHCAVFAFPSLTDTQGIVVIEAMSCGLPVVAVKSGAVAEILRHEREGLLVESESQVFAAALLRLLADEKRRKEMGGLAKERAQEFSSTKCTERVLALYHKAIANYSR